MAAPSYTYSLSNGTNANATHVQQNFTDILNGVTDGTKDLTIALLTCTTVNKVTITAPAASATLTLANTSSLITTGAFATTLAAGATTTLTLPGASGTIATLAGTEALTNKTLTSPNVNEAVALTSTSTKINYLTSAGGTTGTASTNIVFSTSPTITTPNIVGTATNDSAATGSAGEQLGPISRVRSNASTLTSTTPLNVGTTTSITLTSGDWEVRGFVGFLIGATTTVSQLDISISVTSANISGIDTLACPTSGEVWLTFATPATTVPASDITMTIPPYRVSVATATTKVLYLVGKGTFATSTMKLYGFMDARRIR